MLSSGHIYQNNFVLNSIKQTICDLYNLCITFIVVNLRGNASYSYDFFFTSETIKLLLTKKIRFKNSKFDFKNLVYNSINNDKIFRNKLNKRSVVCILRELQKVVIEMDKVQNKWKEIPCSWIRRFNIQVTILPNLLQIQCYSHQNFNLIILRE